MAWKNILNFDVIQNFVKRVTGATIDDELKEKGFKKLSEKYSEEEIYEKEATEIEQELIKIYIQLLEEKGVSIKKRIRLPMPSRGMGGIAPGMVDPEYIKKFLQEYPELRKLLEELLDEEDEDDDYGSEDDRISDMYI